MKIKQKGYIVSIAISLLMLYFGHMLKIQILLFSSLLLILMIIFFCKEENFVPTMLLYLPWSPILKISPGTTSFYTIGACLYAFKYIVTYREKIQPKPVLYIFSLVCVTMIAKIIFRNDFSIDYLSFFTMMIFFILYSNKCGKHVNFEKCVSYMNVGTILSCFAALSLMNYEHMLKYMDVYEWEAKQLIRLSGFYGDPNFYSAQIILAITCNLILLLFSKKSKITNIIFTGLLIYCGTLSVSKSFIILLALVVLLWSIALIITRKKIRLKIIVTISIIVLGIGIAYFGLFKDTIQMYFTRFEMVDNVNSLTTGRSDIQKDYIRFLCDNPMMMLLGQGYTKIYYEDVNYRASHNTIIQSIYLFGIVGVIFVSAWIYELSQEYFEHSNKTIEQRKNSIIYRICMVITFVGFFGPWLGLDVLYFNDFFFFIVLFFISNRYIRTTIDFDVSKD